MRKCACSMVLLMALWMSGCGDSPSGQGTSLRSVPRNRTLITDCSESNICGGQIQDYNSFNPFLVGATSRTGYNFLYEPLYFYLAYQPEQSSLVPWMPDVAAHQSGRRS